MNADQYDWEVSIPYDWKISEKMVMLLWKLSPLYL